MSVTLSDIETLVRYLIDDNSKTGIDEFTYASSAIFTLTESNAISVSDVSRNDVSSGVTYTYNSTTNKVTISSALTSGDSVEVTYTYYANYSSTEIKNYIRAAIVYLSTNCYYTWEVLGGTFTVYPEPERNEKNLIAMITAILIKPDNMSYRLPDITINAPRDLSTNDKIGKTIALFKKNSSHGIFFIG